MKRLKKQVTAMLCVALSLSAAVFLTAGCQKTPENPETEPNTTLLEPTAPPVYVQLPEYEFSYSGELAEQITLEELTDQVGIRFHITLGQKKLPLFTLLLDQVQGDTVQMIENSKGEKIPVSFVMEAIPEGLTAQEEETFCMAQDLVNDVIASIRLK